eukprot:TRINITY_DN24322_c0_g1_i1.p1 TRINITY_DN24322_c0_g1~~TRINITY_DN24322_c0_g1_i1.p1  ORF type:complete len:2197 (-),score=461.11 TRINITY_DN24322_c0_g1_i1:336-6926(-)
MPPKKRLRKDENDGTAEVVKSPGKKRPATSEPDVTPDEKASAIESAKRGRAPDLDQVPATANGPSEQQRSHRPRWGAEIPLREAIIGFMDEDEDDPIQSGLCRPRHSKDINNLAQQHEVPIAKDKRAGYVWVAAARVDKKAAPLSATLHELPTKFTWSSDDLWPLAPTTQPEDSTCDVCGRFCTETLYVFRCYPRRLPGESPEGKRDRRLHPFISYISTECGRGLLGSQSEASKAREKLYYVVQQGGADVVEKLRELWQTGSKAVRQLIVDELRYFAGTDAAEPHQRAELRNAQAVFGELHPRPDDVFRAAGRLLAPTLTCRELASVAMQSAPEPSVQECRFLQKTQERLKARLLLPLSPVTWSKEDVLSTARVFAAGWPLRIEINDPLTDKISIQDAKEVVATLKLVYLPGSGQLRAMADATIEPDTAMKLRESKAEVLEACRRAFARMETLHGTRGPVRAEDRVIVVPEGSIAPADAETALTGITWPNCFSRQNVKPDGLPFIYAFPLGAVLSYSTGLCASTATRVWPNLTRLLCRLLHQHVDEVDAGFRYTTIQLNKDYATKMHVDGNNHGPSYIIGFGDYTGGEVWVLDEDGDVPMQIPVAMRGYPHLQVGKTYMGRTFDCKNKWVRFNGNTPHGTLPFSGTRITMVFFARRGFMRMSAQTRQDLTTAGFRLPEADYMRMSTVLDESGSKVETTGNVEDQKVIGNEVEETEQVVSEMQKKMLRADWAASDWASTFRAALQIQRQPLDLKGTSVGITCHGPASYSTFFALADLLPGVQKRLMFVMDRSDTGRKFLKRNCNPEHIFADSAYLSETSVLCEVLHKKLAPPPADDEDLFVASCSATAFADHDSAIPGLNGYDHPEAVAFKELRRHIEARRPRLALIDVADMESVPSSRHPAVMQLLLHGVDDRGEVPWGLQLLAGYGVSAVDLTLLEFGLPRQGMRTFILLVREDIGGQHAAEMAAKLVYHLNSRVPACTVNDLMFDDDDPRVLEASRQSRHRKESRHAEGKLQRFIAREYKRFNISLEEAPYVKHVQLTAQLDLKERIDHNFLALLNIVYMKAKKSGLDLDGLIVDLAEGHNVCSLSGCRDDGLLPDGKNLSPLDDSGMLQRRILYSFARHRLLTAEEELLCSGLPVWKLDIQAAADSEIAFLVAEVPPVTAVGACMLAMLAATQLRSGQSPAAAPESHIAQIAAEPSLAAVGSLPGRYSQAGSRESEDAAAQDQEAMFGGRAAALLGVLSQRGSFGEKLPKEPKEPTNSFTQKPSAGQTAAVEAAGRGIAVNEPKDWSVRLRKLQLGTDPTLNAPMVMRWMNDAAKDASAPGAANILSSGYGYVMKNVEGQFSSEMWKQRTGLLDHLKSVGRTTEAQEINEAMMAQHWKAAIAAKDARYSLLRQTPQTMEGYIKKFVAGCDRMGWRMKLCLMDHLAAMGGKRQLTCFAEEGGWKLVIKWLGELLKEKRQHGPSSQQLASKICARFSETAALEQVPRLFLDVHDIAWQLPSGLGEETAAGMQSRLLEAVSPALVLQDISSSRTSTGRAVLEAAANHMGSLGIHFLRAVQLLQASEAIVEKVQKNTVKEAHPTEHWQKVKAEYVGAMQKLMAESGRPDKGWSKMMDVQKALIADTTELIEAQIKASVTQDLEAVGRSEALQRAKEGMDVVMQCINAESGSLSCESQDAFVEVAVFLKQVKDDIQECGAAVTPDLRESLPKADKALQRWQEKPYRMWQFCQRLQEQGLSHWIDFLQASGFLEELCIMVILDDAVVIPSDLLAMGLSERVRSWIDQALLDETWARTPVTEANLPPGWMRRYSSKAGQHYFQNADGVARWQWPEPAEKPWENELDKDVEPLSPLHLKRLRSDVLYAEWLAESAAGSRIFCHLCNQANHGHFSSALHCCALEEWKRLRSCLANLSEDLGKVTAAQDTAKTNASDVAPTSEALLKAWRGELLCSLKRQHVQASVEQVFWHTVVTQQLPKSTDSCTLRSILSAVQQMLASADFKETSLPSESIPVAMQTTKDVAVNAASKLWELVGGPKAGSQSADERQLREMLTAMKDLQAAVESRCAEDLNKQWAALLVKSEAAVREHCERPVREARARAWLAARGLSADADVLQACGLLHKLPLLGVDASPAKTAGISQQALAVLAAASSAGLLSEASVAPGLAILPGGWQSTLSRSLGRRYFSKSSGDGMLSQWKWPH